MQPTYATRAQDVATRRWFAIDGANQPLGRLASEAACLLRGKWNPLYAPYLDSGDHVIVLNAAKIRLTGKKLEQKVYYRHTGYPGGQRMTRLSQRMRTRPDEVVRDAIWGMLPKGPLGRQMIRKLKIYSGATHEHAAQKPMAYTLGKHGKGIPTA